MFFLRVLSEGGEGPNTELLWILGILVGFFALTILVGWWTGSRTPNQARAEVEAIRSPKKDEVDMVVKSVKPNRNPKAGRRKK